MNKDWCERCKDEEGFKQRLGFFLGFFPGLALACIVIVCIAGASHSKEISIREATIADLEHSLTRMTDKLELYQNVCSIPQLDKSN